MAAFLNMRNRDGRRETIDELRREDFDSRKAYVAEKIRLLSEYNMAFGGADLYWSHRRCANWSK